MEGLELRTGLLVGATVLLAAICSGSPVPKNTKPRQCRISKTSSPETIQTKE